MEVMDAISWVWLIGMAYIIMNEFFDWRNGRGA